MTYEEYLSRHPTFEDECRQLGMTDTEIETVDDWFFDRTIASVEDFDRYFKRIVKRELPRYFDILRVEAIKDGFDPLVIRFYEDKSKGKDTPVQYSLTKTPAHTKTTHTPAATTVDIKPAETTMIDTPAEVTETDAPAETTRTEKPAEVKVTDTPAETTDITTYNSDTTRSGSTTTTDGGKTIDTRHSEADQKIVDRTNPMSSTVIGTATGNITIGNMAADQISTLTWDDASAQRQTTDGNYEKLEHDFNDSTHETAYNSLKDARSGDDTVARTTQKAGTTQSETIKDGTIIDTTQKAGTTVHTTQKAGTSVKTVQGNEIRKTTIDNPETTEQEVIGDAVEKKTVDIAGEREGERKYQEGKSPLDILMKIQQYTRNCVTASEYLCGILEPCFLSTYDVKAGGLWI